MRIARRLLVTALLAACGDPLPEMTSDADGGGPDSAVDRADAGSDAGIADANADSAAAADAADGAASCFPKVACDGGCATRCPNYGPTQWDQFVVEAVTDGGDVLYRNRIDCNLYRCVVFVQGSTPFDCYHPPVGHLAQSCSLGGDCSTFFNVGLSKAGNCSEEPCTYSCSMEP